MEKKVEILNEMKQISLEVAAIGNANVYTAPPHYFENLSNEIINKVKINVNLPVADIPYSPPPAGYFEDLAGNILFKIKSGIVEKDEIATELEEIAPLLNTISKKNVYSIPDNYFNTLQVFIPQAEIGRTTAKVVSFNRRKSSWFKYAVAAVTAAIIVTGTYFFVGNSSSTETALNGNIIQKISNLSNQEIANYLNNNNVETDISPLNYKLYNNNADIESFLKNVSTEEIKSYLNSDKETGGKTAEGI